MKFVAACLTGILFQTINNLIFGASPSEGMITFLGGWVLGAMTYDEAFRTKGA